MVKPGKAPKKAKKIAKGHIVTKLPKTDKKSYLKNRLGKRTTLVRSIIREISGFAPYERKLIQLVQVGGAKEDKKAMKVAKKRLGTHKRAVKKREYIREIVQKMRQK